MTSNRRGIAKLPEYGAWADMLQRCKNPNLTNFYLYGGRGIKVCERWQTFNNFFEDMGARPDKEHSLDRIDVNGDYEPGNCRWATKTVQNYNKRTNRLITYSGHTMPLTLWARTLGLSPITLTNRLRRNWPIEEALSTPTLAKGAHR